MQRVYKENEWGKVSKRIITAATFAERVADTTEKRAATFAIRVAKTTRIIKIEHLVIAIEVEQVLSLEDANIDKFT